MTGSLLGVWAHPDDEAYLSAGLMAHVRRRGGRVVVVTATAGEHGTADPDRWPPSRLARRRRRELRASLGVLGVRELHLLGYPDGGCSLLDGAASIVEIIEAVRPDTIVTFGPEGMTGHPDHRAVSQWTTAAWSATGRRARLWYATLTPAFHGEWGALNEEVGLWADIDEPPCTDEADLVHSTRLDADVLDLKVAALRAHESQTASLRARVGERTYRSWWQTESFVDVFTHRRLADRQPIGSKP
jgi:LmbE family N-acetylglucosaminyl deacetylase